MAEFKETFEIVGVEESIAALKDYLLTARRKAEKGVADAGLAYQHDVQAHPPPIDTGQYRGSIRTGPVEHDYNGSPFVRVGSPMPQACRLEFGFDNKRDRLGRLYHQKPRPHWLPELRQNRARYREIIIRALK